MNIEELFRRGDLLDKAVESAVRDALRRHKKLGEPVASWRDGRVVVVAPDEIDVEERGDTRGSA